MVREISQFNKNRKLDRVRRIKIFWVTIPLCLLALIALIALMRQPWFFIDAITVQGTRAVDKELLNNEIKTYLNSSWAGLIPKKNIFFFSKKHFREWMITTFSTLEHVDVVFGDKKKLTIEVHEKSPFAVWCQESECFFMDEGGRIFGKAPQFSEGVFVTISGTPLENPIGNYFADDAQIIEILNLIEILNEVPIHVTSITLDKDIMMGVDKVGATAVNPEAVLMIAYTYDQKVLQEVLTMLLADPVFAQSLREKGGAFEYLDLRTSGKMYYKFLN